MMSQFTRLRGEELAARAAELSRHNLVSQEFNCAESTFWGILEALSIPMDPTLMRLATPFGGGIGDSGSLCGALVGGLLVLGLTLGRSDLDHDRKLVAYERSRQLYEQFVSEAGSDVCRVLNPLGFDRLDLRPFCSRYVILAARLTVSVLRAGDPEADSGDPVQREDAHPFEEAGCTWQA
jgi:C_GCAxxG_C_C family probable redox protein